MTQVILVVEDDKAIQAMVKVVLEKSGFEVLIAATGVEMYAVLESAEVSLIILDLGLPDGDALPHIQQIRDQFGIPVIVLTGRQKIDDRLMALGLGAHDYLTKPIDPRELSLRVENMLVHGNREPRPSAPEIVSPAPDFTMQKAASKRSMGAVYGIVIFLVAIGIGGYWLLFTDSQQAGTSSAMTSEPLPAQPVEAFLETREPQPSLPVPKENSSRPTKLSKAEILGYGWVIETKCSPIPDVAWWKLRTHESMASYVLRKYSGDWTPLEESLVGRLARLYDIAERNSGIIVTEGITLRDAELASYIEQFAQRLAIVRCLAAEAEIANAQK